MGKIKERIQPAVRKETEHVMVYTAVGVAAMWCVFLILHLVLPKKVPFDYTVILGGLFGGVKLFSDGDGSAEGSSRDRGGSGKAMDSGELFSEEYDANAVGDSCDCSPLFSVCSWHPSASDPRNSDQTGGSSERKKIRR